jgi:hypothetical protein
MTRKSPLIISLGIVLGIVSSGLQAASNSVQTDPSVKSSRPTPAPKTKKTQKAIANPAVKQKNQAVPTEHPAAQPAAQQPQKNLPDKQSSSTNKAADDEKPEALSEIKVSSGREKNLLGIAGSASQGQISSEQLQYRNISRPGELMELIPGTIATQHSGSGKANQYFLRGFNLDHGTDFTTVVDGIPMNMPTNAHGQGYMDLNSLIPELVDKIDYGKGPYYAEIGDFSAAGFNKISTMKSLPQGFLKFTGGEFDYYRTVAANSTKIGDNGNLLFGAEFQAYSGAWAVPENSHKYNGMLRYTLDQENWGLAINAKAYTNTWTATNQIAQNAIDSGQLGLYGSLSPSDQGSTNRYSLSTNVWNKGTDWKNNINLYALYYDLNLFSNYTGYLNGPWGDQVDQTEHRVQVGGNIEHTRFNKLFGLDMDNTYGLNFRHDQINGLGLYETINRQRIDTITLNNVEETTAGAFIKNETHWLEKFRTISALRADIIDNTVTELANGYSQSSAAYSGASATNVTAYSPTLSVGELGVADPGLAATINAANSGSSAKAMLSPKFSAVFGPWYNTEYFANAGFGYHSNDARGTVLQFNPGYQGLNPSNQQLTSSGDGSLLKPVTPMAWSKGGEIGLRSNVVPKLNSTLALWWLQSSQELVFTGDNGTTSVNGMSDRYGLELTNYYKVNDWLTLDFDLAKSTAYFVNAPQGANFVPNSVGTVIAAGIQIVAPNGMFGTLRLRHFGDSPLDTNGSYWAPDVNLVSLGLGYKQKNYKLDFNIFNLLGQETSDVAYAYQYSSNPNNQTGSYGVVRHPVEPRMARAGFTIYF